MDRVKQTAPLPSHALRKSFAKSSYSATCEEVRVPKRVRTRIFAGPSHGKDSPCARHGTFFAVAANSRPGRTPGDFVSESLLEMPTQRTCEERMRLGCGPFARQRGGVRGQLVHATPGARVGIAVGAGRTRPTGAAHSGRHAQAGKHPRLQDDPDHQDSDRNKNFHDSASSARLRREMVAALIH